MCICFYESRGAEVNFLLNPVFSRLLFQVGGCQLHHKASPAIWVVVHSSASERERGMPASGKVWEPLTQIFFHWNHLKALLEVAEIMTWKTEEWSFNCKVSWNIAIKCILTHKASGGNAWSLQKCLRRVTVQDSPGLSNYFLQLNKNIIDPYLLNWILH